MKAKTVAVAATALAVAATGVRTEQIASAGSATQWNLAWSEEFDGAAGAAPSSKNWRIDLGTGYPGGPTGWGNNELQSYTADPANLALDGNGQLQITAVRNASGSWTSGRIETNRADFAPAAGKSMRVEARIALPDGGQGYWPAFWMLGEPFRSKTKSWPATGEIDVVENVNNNSKVHGALHCGVAPGGPCNERTGRTGSYDLETPAGKAGMHTYSIVWDAAPQRLRYFLDGREYFQVTAARLGKKTWTETFGHGYFLLLNLAVGGNWPGAPDASSAPAASMLVDYVRIYTN